MKVSTIKGPWFSLGFHVDLQKRYIDLHILWWIITIGKDYYGPEDEPVRVLASGEELEA